MIETFGPSAPALPGTVLFVVSLCLGVAYFRRERAARKELGYFFAACPNPCCVANQHYFLKVNPAFCRLLGYSKA
jgi:hypothetical protein